MLRRVTPFVALFAFILLSAANARAALPAPSPSPSVSPSPTPTPSPGPAFGNMSWRAIGPALTGGRVTAVAGSATDPKLYYIGAAGGGVWKSENGAQTWDPVFEKEGAASIGAVTIDPTNNDVVWVGTGEANPRNDVSYGDGVYKTTDGGEHWINVGLKATKYVSRILVDPRNHNHVIVGALGNVFADSSDRGVYVTDDGGSTWRQTLSVGPESGASDLAMDPQNSSVVYAGIWKFQRRPWTTVSGGTAAEDGIYKSTDGGATWTKLEGHGLPNYPMGRIGLAVAPSDGSRVYAVIESKEGVLWRSQDAGASWTMVSDDTRVDARPFYFSHVAVDPKNPNRVYAVSFEVMLSGNAGKTFKSISDQVHSDFHAIWIAPNDPTRILLGNDGGYALSLDGGENWFFSQNVPIGQAYRVGLGSDNPYTVCAGLQDNNGWCGPSNSLDPSGIQNKFWTNTVGGDGTWGIPEPDDPNWIWSDSQNGSLTIYNRVTQDQWAAQPYLQTGEESWQLSKSKYRFNWESPLAFAPWRTAGGKVIGWFGGNVIFQSTDRGRSWTAISPDLTRNLKSHQNPAGGPIINDVSGAEYTGTILDIEGSQLGRGEIWVGTDDGLIQLSRDYGKHWTNVTPAGAPQYGRFATVAPSTLVDGTTYAIEDDHEMGDDAPYVFVTHDFGKHWSKIVNGLPSDQWARAVRSDIRDRNLVYLGTEEGIWISFDGGANWQSFKNDLPTVSVHDIRMQPREDDLVIATHGRSVYIMDDVRPVQELQRAVAASTWLFTPRTSYEWTLHSNDEGTYTNYAADNPPNGVVITFYQKEPQKAAPTLEILDAHGRVLRSVTGTHKVGGKDEPYVPNKAGLNRYTWDFNVNGPVKWNGAALEFLNGPDTGPGVVPGDYSVRMTLSGHTYVKHFRVDPDPRSRFTQAEYQRTFDAAMRQMGHLSQIDSILNDLDSLKKSLDTALDAAKKANNAALTATLQDAVTARKTLFDSLAVNVRGEGTEDESKLHEDLLAAYFQANGLITPAVEDLLRRTDANYRAGVGRYNAFVTSVVPGINAALKQAGMKALPAIKTVNAT
ncbi:MAG: hypothetical protein JO190_01720 [Candidatus Eremiobacteraeota bacterium]|nr:hypothetical protein [Candidatus Eremiobacteraeota bacterium]